MINRTKPHPEWRILVETLQTAEYGSQWSHDQLAALMQVPKQKTRYFGQIQRARKALRDYHRELESVSTKGYRVIEPQDHQAASRRQAVIGRRRLKVSLDIAHATPIELLTAEQNRKLANHIAHIGALVAHASSALQKTRLGLDPGKRADVPKLLNQVG